METRRMKLIGVLLVSFVLVSGQTSESSTPDYDDDSEPDVPSTHVPKFLSESKTYSVREGDKHINLPCEVDDIGTHSTIWAKGEHEILFANDIRIAAPKSYTREPDRSLGIKNIKASDTGTYTCSISSEPKVHLEHRVNVLVPPTIVYRPDPEIKLQKGDKLNLTCVATGNPPPHVTWKKLSGPVLPNGSPLIEGGTVFAHEAKRVHTGKYECLANNGVGKQVDYSVNVEVSYPPEIEVENPVVHSGEGVSSDLTCSVHAEPLAAVHWEKDKRKIHASEYHRTTHSHNRHILQIKKVNEQDFGTYECVARNRLGTVRENIELSGLATPVMYKSNPNGEELDTYDLKWSTNSYSGVIDYKMRLRDKRDGNDDETSKWMDTITIPAESQSGLMQSQNYEITGLRPATSYEVVMSACNKYGCNQYSDVFVFATQGREVTSHQPVVEDNNMADEQGDQDSISAEVSEPDKQQDNGAEGDGNGSSVPVPAAIMTVLTTVILSRFF